MDSTKIIINGQETNFGGQTLVVDETLNVDDAGVLSVVNPNRRVTKAQFDRMSKEEKRGTVIVTDEEPCFVHHPGEVYSTKEIVIGRWIDGRMLYRRVLTVNALTSGYNSIISLPNITYLKVYGITRKINQNAYFLPCYNNEFLVKDFELLIDVDPASLAIVGSSATIVIEYVKTVDSSAVTLESKIPMQKSGSITIDDQEYHYEMPDMDVIASASASSVASASSAAFHF